MLHTSNEFPNTSIYFSAILHKFGKTAFDRTLPKFTKFNGMINYVNNKVFNLCFENQKTKFIQQSNFAVKHDLRLLLER